jgi:hypothetical protein
MPVARVERVLGILSILWGDPRQVQYLRKWVRVLRKPTLDSRMPWLPFRVIDLLQHHLTPHSRVFEFGGGGSTLWFAHRVGTVVTVEHDEAWFQMLQASVRDSPGCRVIHHGPEDDYADYVESIGSFPDGHFDVVVVDGRQRVRCVEAAMPKVRPGGLLILDDSNRAKYTTAFDIAREWPHQTLSGLTPAKAIAGVTTVWRRPLDATEMH